MMMTAVAMMLDASDALAYDAIRTGAAWFHAPRRWTRFRGAKAVDVLNGLVTNDVPVLNVGGMMMAAALSPKGKLVCDMFILRVGEDDLLTGVVEPAADAWHSLVRKYVNPRLCTVTDESPRFHTLAVVGVSATAVVQELEGVDALVHAARFPLLANDSAFLLLASTEEAHTVLARLAQLGVPFGSPALWDVARVEAGWPTFGVDMDENTIPQEANLDTLGAISFSKGCYTGQETVARIHFRGHVNRSLRGLAADVGLERGAGVADANGKLVGDVRSTAISPRFGAIAIAMLRRECVAGDIVAVASSTGAISARVSNLPFTR